MPAATLRTCRLLLLPLLTSAAAEAADPAIDWTNQWRSRYVSEGRDNLPGSGMFATSLVVDSGRLQVSALQLLEDRSPGADALRYLEQNAEVSLGGAFAALEWRVGYKHLWLPASEEDQEVAMELGAELPAGMTGKLAYTYAAEADGGFVELSMEREFFCGRGCSLVSYALVGANQGFVPDGKRGINHIQLGGQLLVLVARQLTLGLEFNHSFPVGSSQEVGLRELIWLGLSLTYQIR